MNKDNKNVEQFPNEQWLKYSYLKIEEGMAMAILLHFIDF